MFGLFKNKRANNHLFVITLDSCRYDSFMAANPENIAKLCGGLHNVEKRFSYASWTAPSHYNLLTGRGLTTKGFIESMRTPKNN